jgi:uncharacterized membrane protein
MKKSLLITTYLVLFSGFLTLPLVLAGCDDTLSNAQVDKNTIPSSNVSFSKNIQPVFLVKCAGSGCHDDISKAGSLSLTSYISVTQSPVIVVKGSPETSELVWAIKGQSGASPMPPPPNITPLTSNQITGIQTWIKEGAKNN